MNPNHALAIGLALALAVPAAARSVQLKPTLTYQDSEGDSETLTNLKTTDRTEEWLEGLVAKLKKEAGKDNNYAQAATDIQAAIANLEMWPFDCSLSAFRAQENAEKEQAEIEEKQFRNLDYSGLVPSSPSWTLGSLSSSFTLSSPSVSSGTDGAKEVLQSGTGPSSPGSNGQATSSSTGSTTSPSAQGGLDLLLSSLDLDLDS